MCGICASYTINPTDDCVSMLQLLRHRGYDSCGVCYDSNNLTSALQVKRTLNGYPQFECCENQQQQHQAGIAIGHTRYTTKGNHESLDQAQPIMSTNNRFALVHNGQIEMPEDYPSSDTHYMLRIIEQAFESESTTIGIFTRIFAELRGSYACALIVKDVGLFVFRDPNGIRPLAYCVDGDTIRFASESCAFGGHQAYKDVQPNGHQAYKDVQPSSVIHVSASTGSVIHCIAQRASGVQICTAQRASGVQRCIALSAQLPKPCLFEFIYLAHDDSVIDGIHVEQARKTMGTLLVQKIRDAFDEDTIDVIVPVPHTPVLAGKVIADELGIDFVELLEIASKSITSRREGRTFILPTQTARENAVQTKFTIKASCINQCRGKNVLIVDDSIVRGTTLKHVVQLIRTQVGPAKIFIASLAPPIVAPNVFGIDIPSTDSLIAVAKNPSTSLEATVAVAVAPSVLVQKYLDVDAPIVYQSLETLKRGLASIANTDKSPMDFEDSVFLKE